MDKKEVFSLWAADEAYVWTKFAKPALFVHTEGVRSRHIYETDIPFEIRELCNKKTAIIVDLPGATGVEIGLGLAQAGFRPVPLYNGIHETKTNGLEHVVDNEPIINALVGGARHLRYTSIPQNAPPAFLLDTNRDITHLDAKDMYDNRWQVDPDDMPDASYMKAQGISSVLIWTENVIRDDVSPIISSYREASIEIWTYINNELKKKAVKINEASTSKSPAVSTEMKEAARKFENARFGLLLVLILAVINLIGMFFVNAEPFLWIAPCIMWLTYLWIPELMGDVIAIAMTAAYLLLFLLSKQQRNLIVAAFILFLLDVLVFYIYVLYYGIAAFTGFSFGYGLIVFIPPIIFLVLLAGGTAAYPKLTNISKPAYLAALNDIDGNPAENSHVWRARPRGRFRPRRTPSYRGFGGYGGTGQGGYGGGGFGGFGG